MGQHWYDMKDGAPVYTVIGANGKERDTTLRDARKLNLVPSVTTVMAGSAKPGLDNYLQTQVLNACLRNPLSKFISGGDGDAVENWKRKTIALSREHSSNAAAKGTVIHDALEQFYLGRGWPEIVDDKSEVVFNIVVCAVKFMEERFGGLKWQPEVSFSHRLGFGGKGDMSHKGVEITTLSDKRKMYSNPIVLDFKTKDTGDIDKMVAYDEHGMQTAAYAVGLDIPNAKRYNLFISTQVPGLLKLTESTDFERDWGMFEALLKLWQFKNKYVPGA